MTLGGSPRLGGATYGFLYAQSLGDAIRALADDGFEHVEIMTTPPHVPSVRRGEAPVDEIRRAVDATGVQLEALNPTYLDLNLASTNDLFRRFAVDVLIDTIDLAAEIGARRVVLALGRLHPLIPAPLDWLRPRAVDAIRRCAEHGAERGVEIVLENLPAGFMQTGAEIAELCRELDVPGCSVVYDVANGYMVEDPVDGIAACADVMSYVHLSDTTRDAWEHARVGTGAIDFVRVFDALAAADYSGISMLEIIDRDTPEEALVHSAQLLGGLGWRTPVDGFGESGG